jgi:excisionase family DNA binding protein
MQIVLPDKLFFRPDEVATILGVSRSTVYLWCQSEVIEAIKIRKQIRISKSILIEFLQKSKISLSNQ